MQTTQNQDYTEEVAGFKLLKDSKKYDFASIQNKQHFGNLWEFHTDGETEEVSRMNFRGDVSAGTATTFVGLQSLSRLLDTLPVAEYVDPVPADGYNAEAWARFRGVRNAETKYPFGVHSRKYAMIQYPTMFDPMIETCQQNDLHIAGKLEVLDHGGRVGGRAIIGNPESVIEVLTDSGEYILMGFRVGASHDGTGAMALKPFAVDTICCNENIWGEWLPSFSIKHIGRPEEQAKKFEDALLKYLKMVPTIKEKIDAANETAIINPEMVLAALGVGFSPRHIAKWAPEKTEWEPPLQAKTYGTLWNLSNSLTAYVTHSCDNLASDTRDQMLTQVGKLLNPEEIDKYIDQGREKAQALREKREEQIRKGDRRTVPEIEGITVGKVA